MTAVKICGLRDIETLRAALNAGAEFIGLVFHSHSPRNVDISMAWNMAREVPDDVTVVGLFVNPTDKEITKVLSQVRIDIIQLHGDEDPMRILEIKAGYKKPVMKAMRVGSAEDLRDVRKFEKVADWLLFDAKSDVAHGGTGQSFDWSILRDVQFQKPWMLAGGLNAHNIQDALKVVKPDAVDVSSGVESAPGIKDPDKIRAFIECAK
jgi:phosphoribosylanthranilate isomerase